MVTERSPASPQKIRSGEFNRIYQGGRRAIGRLLILVYEERERDYFLAVVASRKIGNAVQRNRAKRLLREAFRIHWGRLTRAGAYVLLARAGISERKTEQVAGELEKLLTRLNLLSVSDELGRNVR